jgi:CelD/BcsL family acetyltransferase involved in cellulose biosynthesis
VETRRCGRLPILADGIQEVAQIADTPAVARARVDDASKQPQRVAVSRGGGVAPLAAIDVNQWRALAERAIEPNGYYLPGWALAVNAFASGRTDVSTLVARDRHSQNGNARLIGLMPFMPMARAYKIPLPAFVSAEPYGTLCTPPLDPEMAHDAARELMRHARDAGAHALVLRDVSLDGAVMRAFSEVLRQERLRWRVLKSHLRACLDATRDCDDMLREALGAKKLKELRRQRHRLAEHGAVSFAIARTADEVTTALETFLSLEASGWKGMRRTALIQDDGDARFIRRAAPALAEHGQCEVVTLTAGNTAIAAGIVLRHQERAFYFKLGIDERFAKFSPGVQLTLDLTRHLCDDPAIATADSTASADHPMINPIWRGRFAIGDVLIPLRRNDPMVWLIQAAIIIRGAIQLIARRAIHLVRSKRRPRLNTTWSIRPPAR